MKTETNHVDAHELTLIGGFHLRVLRREAELATVRAMWEKWQRHPHVDPDFFLTIVRTRREVISPYVMALYRHDVLETLLVGRLEHGLLNFGLGYWQLLRVPIRALTFAYGGLLGNTTEENCSALFRALPDCLKRTDAQMASLHFVSVGSPIHRVASRERRLLSHDHLAETRPHWVMKLPNDVEAIYDKLSPKARRNRRYEANRLTKAFSTVRVDCYTREGDLERVFQEAESIARRTYQRGLGVGFVANHENRERFLVEAGRGRFRAYFLYLDQKPVAFFMGTMSRNVLYDNFTAYDPDYSRYSPGTVLFFHLFDRLCREGVEAIDFGFGDAWYKSQFGTEKSEESMIAVFAPTLRGVGLNLARMPVAMLDLLAKKAVERLAVLRSVKKRWRARAQKRTSA